MELENLGKVFGWKLDLNREKIQALIANESPVFYKSFVVNWSISRLDSAQTVFLLSVQLELSLSLSLALFLPANLY